LCKPTIRNRAYRKTVTKPQLPALDSKEMGVRYTARPSNKSDDGSSLRIRNEAPIGELHAGRHADIAAVIRHAAARTYAPFKTVARRAPRHFHAVVNVSQISVSSRLRVKSILSGVLTIPLSKEDSTVFSMYLAEGAKGSDAEPRCAAI